MNRAASGLQATDRIGLLCAGLAAVGFSGKAILVKLAYRHGVDAETLLALRMALAIFSTSKVTSEPLRLMIFMMVPLAVGGSLRRRGA